jgi:hypothetical protein
MEELVPSSSRLLHFCPQDTSKMLVTITTLEDVTLQKSAAVIFITVRTSNFTQSIYY